MRTTVVLGAAFLIGTPVARAGSPPHPPSGNAAIDVYVEQIPTGSGSVAANGSGKAKPSKKLQEATGSDAGTLAKIASSQGVGAPPAAPPAPPTPVVSPTPRVTPHHHAPSRAATARRITQTKLTAQEKADRGATAVSAATYAQSLKVAKVKVVTAGVARGPSSARLILLIGLVLASTVVVLLARLQSRAASSPLRRTRTD